MMFSSQASQRNPFSSPGSGYEKDNVIFVQSPTGSLDGAEFSNKRSSIRRSPLRPSSPANSRRPPSPLASKAAQRSPKFSKPLPCGKVEIFVRCDELPKMDAFSSSDPICVLYVQRYGQWIEYGRTECIPNCHKPKFTESFILDTNSPEHQNLKLSVFDSENLTSKDLHKHQLIGSMETQLFDLMTSENEADGHCLQFQEQKSKRGKIYITLEELDEQAINTKIKLCLSALKLSKKGLNIFGKCDAYFELEKKLKDDRYHPIYRSEVIFRNSEPRWRPFEISLQKLCNGNKEAGVLITVYNYHTKGDHACIGSAETSYAGMTRRIGDVKTLPLRKGHWTRTMSIDSKRGRHDSLGKAMIRILQCVPEEQFSLVDYVKGGCVVNFVAAIDFSSSNGSPEEDSSLHHVSEYKMNVYEEALHGIGSWLSYYDPRNCYELYGFAGILNGDATNMSCFPLRRNGFKKMFAGGQNSIEEMVFLYRSYLKSIELSGPTLFKPVLERIRADLRPTTSQESQHFTLALILTDGIANDMAEFFELLTTCSDEPISIIVACLGPLRLETVNYFNILDDTIVKKCGRTMIYPVAFSDENIHLSLQSIRSTFAKLSKDIVKFYKHHGIRPNKPILNLPRTPGEVNHNDFSPDVTDPLQAAENDNWQNSMKDATSFCPTCGSHSAKNSYMPEVVF